MMNDFSSVLSPQMLKKVGSASSRLPQQHAGIAPPAPSPATSLQSRSYVNSAGNVTAPATTGVSSGTLDRTVSLNAEEQARIRSKNGKNGGKSTSMLQVKGKPLSLTQAYQKIFVAEAYLGPPEIVENEIEIHNPFSSDHDTLQPVTYRGRCRSQDCAVKLLHLKAEELSDDDINSFHDDIKRLSSARHPNIALFMGATTTGPLMIVSEQMHTNLASLIHEGTHLSLFQRLLLVKDIALALNWLHDRDRPIYHGNLTPNNILISDSLQVKVSDYGLSNIKRIQRKYILRRLQKEGKPQSLLKGDSESKAARFSAPELLLHDEPATDKSDVFSFAMMLWMVVTKKVPFTDIDDVAQIRDLLARGQRPEIPINCMPSLKSLMEDCWHEEAQKRPPFKAILKRLEAVIVDSAILDQSANLFWRRNFGDSPVVNWTEFLDAFALEIALVPVLALKGSVASLSKLEHTESTLLTPKLKLQIDILRALLVERRQALSASTSASFENEIVSLELFGRLISWLGPLHIKIGSGKSLSIRGSNEYETNISFVDRLQAVISQPWFHGLISAEESERILLNKPAGTFLLRFSTAAFGVFTITKVTTSSTIHHQRILHVLETDLYQVNDRFYPSLVALVQEETERLQLLSACYGSKFTSIILKEQNGGYI